LQIIDGVNAIVERFNGAGGEQRACVGVEDIERLAAASMIPIEEIESDAMGEVVGEGKLDFELRGRIPAGGEAGVVGSAEQGSGVGGGTVPDPATVAGGGDVDEGGIILRVLQDVIALGSVSAFPIPAGGGIGANEGRGGGAGRNDDDWAGPSGFADGVEGGNGVDIFRGCGSGRVEK
jgi:hypothetical protein